MFKIGCEYFFSLKISCFLMIPREANCQEKEGIKIGSDHYIQILRSDRNAGNSESIDIKKGSIEDSFIL